MHRALRKFIDRFVPATLFVALATLGTSVAQESDASNLTEQLAATNAAYFDDLPENDGRLLLESTVADVPSDEAIQSAGYVELTYSDRSFLFQVSGATAGEEVRVKVAGDVEGASDGSQATLANVVERLDAGIDGDRNLLLTSRREGDVNVVTGIYGLDTIDSSRELMVEPDSRILLLNAGNSLLRTVAESGATFADLTVQVQAGVVPLLSESEGNEDASTEGDAAVSGDSSAAEGGDAGASAPAGADASVGDDAVMDESERAAAEAERAAAAAAGDAAQNGGDDGDGEAETDIETINDVAEGAGDSSAQGETGFALGLGVPLSR